MNFYFYRRKQAKQSTLMLNFDINYVKKLSICQPKMFLYSRHKASIEFE